MDEHVCSQILEILENQGLGDALWCTDVLWCSDNYLPTRPFNLPFGLWCVKRVEDLLVEPGSRDSLKWVELAVSEFAKPPERMLHPEISVECAPYYVDHAYHAYHAIFDTRTRSPTALAAAGSVFLLTNCVRHVLNGRRGPAGSPGIGFEITTVADAAARAIGFDRSKRNIADSFPAGFDMERAAQTEEFKRMLKDGYPK